MNRPIQLIIYSLLLIALYFIIALSFEACGNKKKAENSKVESALEKSDEEEFFEDDYGFENEDEPITYTSDDTDSAEEVTQDVSNTDDYSASEKANNANQDYTQSATLNSAAAQQKYLVIAGNFLIEQNAKRMVDKLNSKGYTGAEISIFDYSQYYTVIASRSETYNKAQSTSNNLKREGIDCYIHTRK